MITHMSPLVYLLSFYHSTRRCSDGCISLKYLEHLVMSCHVMFCFATSSSYIEASMRILCVEHCHQLVREKDGEKELGRYNTLPPLSNKLPGAGPSVQNLRLVFSSSRHGRSLSSLYEMVGGRSPCILLLR